MADADCCSPQADDALVCPHCGTQGKPVAGQTVKALLSVSLRAVQAVEYRFCAAHTCPVVYFSSDGEHIFTATDVRERIYQKEPESDTVLICYCFRHSVGDLRAASPRERMVIVDDITAGIKAGQCACDLRNPQGTCCLGNVRKRLAQPA